MELDAVTLLPDAKKGASMLSCVLNLCNTIMGTGILALPYALSGTGTVLGAIFLTLAASTCILSLHLLCEAARVSGRPATFYSVCEAAFPRLSLAVDTIIVFNGFLACVSFLIVAGDSFSKLFIGGPNRQVWTLLSLGCVAPLSLLRRLDALKFTSALSVVVLLLISSIVILFSLRLESPLLSPCAPHEASDQCHGLVEAIGAPLGIVREFATFVVAFTCQQNIFNCTNEMRDPTPRRCLQMITLSIGLASTLYAAVGYAGYLTFGSLVQSDILATYPQDNDLVFAARLGIALVVITCYPLQAFALRMSLATLLDAVCQACCTQQPLPPPSADGSNATAATEEGKLDGDHPPAVTAALGRTASARADTGGGGSGGGGAPAAVPESAVCGALGRVFALDPRSVGVVAALLASNTALALHIDKLGLVVDINGSLAGTAITFIVPGVVYYLLFPSMRTEVTGKLAMGVVMAGVVLVPVSLTAAFLPASNATAS